MEHDVRREDLKVRSLLEKNQFCGNCCHDVPRAW